MFPHVASGYLIFYFFKRPFINLTPNPSVGNLFQHLYCRLFIVCTQVNDTTFNRANFSSCESAKEVFIKYICFSTNCLKRALRGSGHDFNCIFFVSKIEFGPPDAIEISFNHTLSDFQLFLRKVTINRVSCCNFCKPTFNCLNVFLNCTKCT